MATSPMDRLRSAIIAAAREQMGMVDSLTEVEEELVAAWNEVADAMRAQSFAVTGITETDYDIYGGA